jgi:proline iminopeptidase
MLYPPIQPFITGMLDVGQGHLIYFEACGNPSGIPVVFLHGGPGGGCSETSRRFFDPARYRTVLFDQRGCGRSTPHASESPVNIEHISTQLLVQDIERLRTHLGIARWAICGGSWGCTLALAYAQQHFDRVTGIVMRGVFGAQQRELDWLYKAGGASQIFPKEWEAFETQESMTANPQSLLQTYNDTLENSNPAINERAALAWCAWESSLCSIHPSAVVTAPPSPADIKHSLAMARISAHLFTHDPALLANNTLWQTTGQPLDYLAGIAGIIVQGQFDMVTPALTAWQLHKAWAGSELRMVHTAGHTSSDPALQASLVLALDDMATILGRRSK